MYDDAGGWFLSKKKLSNRIFCLPRPAAVSPPPPQVHTAFTTIMDKYLYEYT